MSSASRTEPTEAGEAAAKPLGIAETIEVIARIGAVAENVVLIGGQALNFWAKQYLQRAPELHAEGPFASKDIDFCGTQEEAGLCARALGGRAAYQSTDALSRCVGIVYYVDADDEERQLDFLSKPFGLETENVFDMSFPATITARNGKQATIRVMHPFHCFMSRVANVGGLEQYRTEHGVRQLRASIVCMRAFLQLELDGGEGKTVNKLHERAFRFCVESDYAQRVFELYEIEPFDVVLRGDERLPAMFNTKRYPQMQEHLAKRRAAR